VSVEKKKKEKGMAIIIELFSLIAVVI